MALLTSIDEPGSAGRASPRRVAFGETHVREGLRNMRVHVAVTVPGPAGAELQRLAVAAKLLKARAIDAPHVALVRRQRASIGQPFQTGPRKRDLGRPTAIDVPAVIECAVDEIGRAHV